MWTGLGSVPSSRATAAMNSARGRWVWPLRLGLAEDVQRGRLGPRRRVAVDAVGDRELVGLVEADARDPGQRVGLLEHRLGRRRSVQDDDLADEPAEPVRRQQRVEAPLDPPLLPLVGGPLAPTPARRP